MGIIQPSNPKPFYIEAAEKPVQAICLALSSLLVSLLYMCFLDFAQSYIVPSKHFPKRVWGQVFPESKPGSKDFKEVLKRGSERYPDKVYRIPHHPHEWVIVPYRMTDEIRNIPESSLSFQKDGVTNRGSAVADILKTSGNSIIDVVYGAVQDESYRTVLENIGDCSYWTTVRLLPQTISMIMAISQRVFVGEPLCRDEEWLQSIYQAIQDAVGSIPLRDHKAKAKKLLAPVLEKRLRDMKDSNWEPPPDMMQIILDSTEQTGEGRSLTYQVNSIINTGRAALLTTGLIIYQLVYDLAVHPEYIAPLRQEILDLGDVPFTRVNVNKLSKLDSFIRESQRWGKFMLGGTFRKVLDDLTLSDGTRLSAGTNVGTNVQNAAFDNSTLAKQYEFDGFRFDRLRSVPGQEQMYQSVQTSADDGYGNELYPGRFFAAHSAKVVMIRILMSYDFRVTSMPAQHELSHVEGITTDLHPSVDFEFKKRA